MRVCNPKAVGRERLYLWGRLLQLWYQGCILFSFTFLVHCYMGNLTIQGRSVLTQLPVDISWHCNL